jgi:hypothetical protein
VSEMNGAEALLQTLIDSGVEVCFANTGTSEIQLVAVIDKIPGMRPLLGLFEGVVTGAAAGSPTAWRTCTMRNAPTLPLRISLAIMQLITCPWMHRSPRMYPGLRH